MIRFINITMRNFLTYGNVPITVNLERPGTTLVRGENLDAQGEAFGIEGTGSNGVGKTTMFSAIVYALYDLPLGEVAKIDNLINNVNKKNMEVILEFIADDGRHIKIHRMRKMKTGAEGNKVHLYIDGEDKTPGSAAATNEEIVKIIGIPYDLFTQIIVFSASEDGFLQMKSDKQKEFIENLFGITVVAERAEVLKKKIKEQKGNVEIKQTKVDQLVKEHERHQQLIESAKKRVVQWKVQNQASIDSLFTKLEQIQNVDFEGEALLHARASELKTKLQEQTARLRESTRNSHTLNTNIGKVSTELKHLKDATCPYCMQHFKDAGVKIVELEAQYKSIGNEIELSHSESAGLEKQVETIQRQFNEVRELITVPNLDALMEIKNESKNIKRRIAELDSAANPFEEPLQELLDTKIDDINYDDLNKEKKLLEHQQFLQKLLTKTDSFVRKTLISNNLPFLNKHLKKHLQSLGLPHTVEFTESLDIIITKQGNDVDFNLLSRGQKARLDFGLSVAFKDMRERLHGKTNLVVFDEVLDEGLDAVGVVACAKLLKQLAQKENLSLYVISHRDEISTSFDRKLTVRMEKGFSYILEGEYAGAATS